MKCVSLFSGCGGLDLGVEQAGFRVVMANDNELLCKRSADINFPHTKFIVDSIENLSPDIIENSLNGEGVNDVALLIGGPPCPPFSKSRFYRKDKPRGLDDPIGNTTVNGYLSVLAALKPQAFLFENVHGFAYKVHKEAFNHVLDTAERLGYSCTWEVVNAADYGVPQIRKRFILVGTRSTKKFKFPKPTHCDPKKLDSKEKLRPWRNAGDVLIDIDTDEKASDEGHFAGGKHHDLLCQVPPGDNYLYFTEKRGHPNPKFIWRSRYWSFLLKLSPDLPSWTIQARRSNNMGPLHWRNRILRIEEVKRLQTFPDSWYLAGNIEQQWRQVGNAVPPLLAKQIAVSIKEHLS